MATKNKKNCTCKKSDLELSLIQSEEKFRLLMELATDGVLIVQDGKIKEVNYYLAQICGYTIDEVLDTDLASYFHPDDIETIEKIFEKPIEDENALAVHELTIMCKNGLTVDVEVIAGRFRAALPEVLTAASLSVSSRRTSVFGIGATWIRNRPPASVDWPAPGLADWSGSPPVRLQSHSLKP